MTKSGLTNIIRSVAEGDHNAFRTLYDLLYLKAYRFARIFLNDPSDCEAVLADVFYILWEKRKLLGEVKNIQAYIFRIIRNESVNYLKKKKKGSLVSLDDMPVELSAAVCDAEDALIEDEMMKTLKTAIDSLPERCKTIFIMVREQKLSHKEVATMLSITPGTVEVQMNIAIKKIKSMISLHLTP